MNCLVKKFFVLFDWYVVEAKAVAVINTRPHQGQAGSEWHLSLWIISKLLYSVPLLYGFSDIAATGWISTQQRDRQR